MSDLANNGVLGLRNVKTFLNENLADTKVLKKTMEGFMISNQTSKEK